MTRGRGPCLVGLTGGLASGKSAVAVLLGRRGVPVFDADAEVHRLYGPGNPGAVAVRELFGDEVLHEDGSVDRGVLAARVVGDPDAMGRLNAVVHPLVRRSVTSWASSVEAPAAVVEAALLVETGSSRGYDVLVVVWCTAEQQLERALARGMDEERARGLLASQLPMEAKIEVADVAIDNSGDFGDLPAEVDRAWRQVLSLCSARCLLRS